MSEESAIVKTCLSSPENDEPRRVRADWLEDNGNPDLAEFIRIQSQLREMQAHADALRKRRTSLIESGVLTRVDLPAILVPIALEDGGTPAFAGTANNPVLGNVLRRVRDQILTNRLDCGINDLYGHPTVFSQLELSQEIRTYYSQQPHHFGPFDRTRFIGFNESMTIFRIYGFDLNVVNLETIVPLAMLDNHFFALTSGSFE